MWNILRNGNQMESSSPFSESSDLGCTQGEAEVDQEAARAKANHYRRMTTTIVVNCLYVAGTGKLDLLWFGRSTWRHVENLCQKVNTIDSLYQPIETLQSILLCWRQDGGLKIWFVSGRIFGGRCTRFKGGGNTNSFPTSWIYKKQTAVSPQQLCVGNIFLTDPTIPNQREITMCSRISQADPNCEVCMMKKITPARCKNTHPWHASRECHLQLRSESLLPRTTQDLESRWWVKTRSPERSHRTRWCSYCLQWYPTKAKTHK